MINSFEKLDFNSVEFDYRFTLLNAKKKKEKLKILLFTAVDLSCFYLAFLIAEEFQNHC